MYRLLVRCCPFLLFAAVFWLFAASAHGRERETLSDHPLVTKIWAVAQGDFIDRDTLMRAASAADLLIIGERHDNAAHHAVQADLVSDAVAVGRRPALVFEMMTRDRQGAIDKVLRDSGDADAATPSNHFNTVLAALADAAAWSDSGWPDWAFYRPIAASVVKAGGPIIAADIDQAMKQATAKDGMAALPQRWRDTLSLDQPLPPAMHAAIAGEIETAHCGFAPTAMIAPMVRVQRARDAALAMAMLDGLAAPTVDQAILITGNGHARGDRGVPWLLRQARGAAASGAQILSIGLIEVRPGIIEPQAYRDQFHKQGDADGGKTAPLPYDMVVFTPRVDLGDPCTRFHEQLENMKAGETDR